MAEKPPSLVKNVLKVARIMEERTAQGKMDYNPTTLEALKDIGRSVAKIHRNAKAADAKRLRRANRGALSGQSKQIGIRLKADAYEDVQRRADQLGLSIAEYVRLLLRADTGAAV